MSGKSKIIAFLLFAFIAISAFLLGLKIVEKKDIQNRSIENRQTLDQLAEAIPFEPVDSMRPTVLIYMNSECEHCKWQLKEMERIEDSLKETQIILVSIEPVYVLKSYLERFLPKIRDRFITHHITSENVDPVFGTSAVPQIYIYKENQLVRSFKGETKAQLISEALEN